MNKNEIFMGPENSFIAYTCSSFTLQQASKCTPRFYRLEEIASAVTSAVESERKLALKQLEVISGKEKGSQYIRVENYLQRQIDSSVDTVRKNMTQTRRIKARYESGKLSDAAFEQELGKLEEEDRAAEKEVMSALIRIRDFRKCCNPDNPWLVLFSSLPEELDFIHDGKLVHKLVKEICVYPDRQPQITLSHMEEKEIFMNTLYRPLRTRSLKGEKAEEPEGKTEREDEQL